MIARIQQIIFVGLVSVVLAWSTHFGTRGEFGWAALGPVVVVAAYAGALALEFAWLRRSYRGAAGRPTFAALARAWWQEATIAPRVFLWTQPFRSRAIVDSVDPASRRGVVLVHGFFCNRGFWNPWLRVLKRCGVPFVAVDLAPPLGSIDGYEAIVDAAVARIERATGRPALIVAHSMGGLAVRAWLHRRAAHGRFHHVVTIATPHAGTWIGRFARSLNGHEMRLGSAWLSALEKVEDPTCRARFTCWWSDCDNIVFPTRGATLPGADNRFVRGLPHVALAFHPPILEHVLLLARQP